MAYWTATRLQPHREHKAEFFLQQFGFETYLPRCRYRDRRRRTKVVPLFPGYIFVRIEQFWRDIRLLPGVIKPVMSGDAPAHVADEIIAGIRAREVNGAIDLRRKKLSAGDRVRIIEGILAGRRGRYAGETRHHVRVLLQLLGDERQVLVSPDVVEAIG